MSVSIVGFPANVWNPRIRAHGRYPDRRRPHSWWSLSRNLSCLQHMIKPGRDFNHSYLPTPIVLSTIYVFIHPMVCSRTPYFPSQARYQTLTLDSFAQCFRGLEKAHCGNAYFLLSIILSLLGQSIVSMFEHCARKRSWSGPPFIYIVFVRLCILGMSQDTNKQRVQRLYLYR